jgi:hypothetical protein
MQTIRNMVQLLVHPKIQKFCNALFLSVKMKKSSDLGAGSRRFKSCRPDLTAFGKLF